MTVPSRKNPATSTGTVSATFYRARDTISGLVAGIPTGMTRVRFASMTDHPSVIQAEMSGPSAKDGDRLRAFRPRM